MLQSEFSNYGEIVDSIVMKNSETGNSRGFGFITFKDNSGADLAVSSGSHKIDGKIVDVKLCNPRLAAQQRNSKQKNDNCKVFVGGLPHGVSDEEIKQFFSRYGQVKEFKMMYDENKQRPRGFGFITFELEESSNQGLQEHYIQFNGKQIEVKPQIHNIRQQTINSNMLQPHQGHFGGMPNWNSVQPMRQHQGAPINGNGGWGSYGGGSGGGMANVNQPWSKYINKYNTISCSI
jgi:RNA-binding protein Musashi